MKFIINKYFKYVIFLIYDNNLYYIVGLFLIINNFKKWNFDLEIKNDKLKER